ncbi:MAG TPA: HipA domain-containing protein [Microbacteriaceae bacterium]|nr:HipA domain-containing protein [Microbacteriaceae bacterium]
MAELEVHLYGTLLGHLVGERARFDFVAAPAALERFGIGATVLSLAIPLSANPRAALVGERRNFFEELLPEGRHRKRLADNAHIDESNTMAMLRRYGRDVAGAVQIIDSSDPAEPRTPSVQPIGDARVRELFSLARVAPLGNTGPRRLSSLAGVQDKVLLARTEAGWAEPVDGYPTTHILKPSVDDMPTLIYDEEYGARIARHLGLADHETGVVTFDGTDALVVERYDRGSVPGGRIHQEDFNQALGYFADQKYETSGHAGLATIAETLREQAGLGDVEQLLRLVTMSVAVGNLDMHAKNLSILHHLDGSIRLAPAYDIVPQLHLGVGTQFAFAISGELEHDRITRSHLIDAGRSWGLRNAPNIVDDVLAQVATFATTEQPLPGAHPDLAADIARFTANLMAGIGASQDGTAPSARPETHPRALPVADGGWGGPVRGGR